MNLNPPDSPSPPEAILARGAGRLGSAAPYAGALTPPEAWRLVQSGAATLVDVRAPVELKYVGRVPGAVHVEWLGAEAAAQATFVRGLQAKFQPDDALLMMCRSGVRSKAAAGVAAGAGFRRVYDVLEGFEGKLDANKQRGHLDGWRLHGLPWEQD